MVWFWDGSGISWTICKQFAPCSRQITTPTHIHTHTRLTALFLGLRRWVGTRKVKPIWILLKQETVIGSGISWAICKSAPCSRQTTTPTPHHSIFNGRMLFLMPNQLCQSTEGSNVLTVVRQKLHTGPFFFWSTNWFPFSTLCVGFMMPLPIAV